jgi:hypothetical protein
VCAAAGDVPEAFAAFQRAQAAAAAAAGPLDSHVYGALIAACAAGIRARSSERKDQLVLLDRAFGVLQDAMAAGAQLDTPAWNALLMCTGAANPCVCSALPCCAVLL